MILKPYVTDYIWGGTKLKTEYGLESDKEKVAEGWMLSCHKDGSNVILNGELKGKTLPEICNYVSVHKGDVFFISAGTLHAIGEGILIAEVQQNSNTTYRVSDYGRLSADGKPRELHIEKALDVTARKVANIPYGNVGNVEISEFGCIRDLADCEFFTSKLISLNGEIDFYCEDNFISLVVLDGEFGMNYDNQTINAVKGSSAFIPAGLNVKLKGKAEILYSRV